MTAKELDELKDKIVAELKIVPKEIKTGGQSVGVNDNSIRVIHEDLNFELKINEHRSSIKNFELAKRIFRFYLDTIIS